MHVQSKETTANSDHSDNPRAGTHEYSYVADAITPGVFVVPPAKAEEIYAPEVFGRSGSDVVVIEDR